MRWLPVTRINRKPKPSTRLTIHDSSVGEFSVAVRKINLSRIFLSTGKDQRLDVSLSPDLIDDRSIAWRGDGFARFFRRLDPGDFGALHFP